MRNNRIADSLRIHGRLRKTAARLGTLSSYAGVLYQGENLLAYISSVKDSLSKVLFSLIEMSDNARVFNRVELENPVPNAFFTDVTTMVDETNARLAAVQAVQGSLDGIAIQFLTQGPYKKTIFIINTDGISRRIWSTSICGKPPRDPRFSNILLALRTCTVEPSSGATLRVVQSSAIYTP